MPFLVSALERLLLEYPDHASGIGTTERFVLELLEEFGKCTGAQLFKTLLGIDEPSFLGDWSFFAILRDLASSPGPLISAGPGDEDVPGLQECADAVFQITPIGLRVLKTDANAIEVRGIDKWIGGVHLTANNLWTRSHGSSAAESTGLDLRGPSDLTS